MRALTGIALVSTFWLSQAQLIVPYLHSRPFENTNTMTEPDQYQQQQQQQQQPLNAPGIQLPSSDPSSSAPTAAPPADPSGPLVLSDTIGNARSINTFAGYTRDVESVENRLENASLNTTVLAPLNTAVWALPRKPWEDPREYGALGENAYEGDDGFGRARENLRRFTEAHIVPVSPWKEGDKVKSLGGATLWWEKKDGKTLIQPGAVEVKEVVSRVANGEAWVIEKVLNYA